MLDNLRLPVLFYSSVMFVTDILFILEKFMEYTFVTLITISDKFRTKLNGFSFTWFWSNDLQFLENFRTIFLDF